MVEVEVLKEVGQDSERRKHCSSCRVEQPFSEFNKNRARPDGHHAACKTCRRGTRAERPSKLPTPEAARRSRLKKKYGLSLAQHDAMRIAQGGLCAICNRECADPHVDHDHITNAIRGLLCHSCNVGLGHFGDDKYRLMAAIEYLESHEGVAA